MKHRNLKWLGLLVVTGLLCFVLFTATAFALHGGPIGLDVEREYGPDAVFDGEVASGSYEYNVFIELPEGKESFEFTMDSDGEGQPQNWEEIALADLPRDGEGRAFMRFNPYVEDGLVESETAWFRLNENSSVQKLVLEYNVCQSQASINELEGGVSLRTPFQLSWDITPQPEAGQEVSCEVIWRMPNRQVIVFPVESANTLEFTDGMLSYDRDFNLDEVLSQAGTYSAWVVPFVDGAMGVESEMAEFAVVPEGDEKISLEVEMGENGLGLHEDLEYTVYAPGADDNRVEVFFGDGESEECWLNDDEDDEEEYGRGEGWHSYHEEDWPEYEGEEPGPHSYVMYARAWFDGVEVYSNPVDVPVYVDPEKALTGEVNYRVLNDRAPRDGVFRVEVDPVDDAEFYEAFIDTDEGWIAVSNWVDAIPGESVILSVPAGTCEPGEYQLGVYAGRRGAKYHYSETMTAVTVGEAEYDGDIIVSMKDTFEAGEPLRISAYYPNKDNLEDFWMNVRIYPSDNPEDEIYDEDGGDEVRDNEFAIWNGGEYVLVATVYQDITDGEPEAYCSVTRNLTVTSEGDFVQDYDPDLPAYLPLKEDENDKYVLTIPFPKGADGMDVRIFDDHHHFDRDQDRWGVSRDQTFKFNTYEGLRLRVIIRAFKYGYDEFYYHVEGIPVLNMAPENSIEIETDQEAGTDLSVNQEIWIRASAPGARWIRLADNNDDGFDEEDGETIETGRSVQGYAGEYRVWAVAGYFDEETEEWTEYASEPIVFQTVYTDERVGDFEISADKTGIVSGEPVTLTFSYPEYSEDWGLDLWDDVDEDNDDHRRFDWDWAWADGWSEQGQRHAIVSTAGLPAGEYKLCAWASAVGRPGNDSNEIIINVTEPQDMPDVLFTVDRNTVSTEEDFTFSLRAPGADWVEVDFDYPNDDWEDRGRPQWSAARAYGHAGEYTLLARAHYFEKDQNGEPVQDTDEEGKLLWNDENEPIWKEATKDSEPVTITVTADGDLKFENVSLTGVPLYGTADEDGRLTFEDGFEYEVPLPANAEWMDAGVNVEGRRGDLFSAGLSRSENEQENVIRYSMTADELNALELRDGDVLRFWANAHAFGYNEGDYEQKVPVLASEEGQPVLSFANAGGDTLEGVAIHEPVEFVVTAPEGKEMERIHFYHGTEFREEDEGPDEDGAYTTDESWGEPGTYTVFARVTYDEWQDEWDELDYDPRTWVTTNALTVRVKEPAGDIAPFGIALDSNEADRGDTVRVTLTRGPMPEGVPEDDYNDWEYELELRHSRDGREDELDYDWDWDWTGDWETGVDGQTQTRGAIVMTAELPAGETYQVYGKGWYPDYAEYWTDGVDLTIVEPDVSDTGVLFSPGKTQAQTEEDVALSVYAPGADWVEILENGEHLHGWVGDSCTFFRSWGNAGSYELTARAHYFAKDEEGNPIQDTDVEGGPANDEDGNPIWVESHTADSDPITIEVTAPNGDLAFDEAQVSVTDQLYGTPISDDDNRLVFDAEEQNLSLYFPLPENAGWMEAGARVEGWNDDLFSERIDSDDDNLFINTGLSGDELTELGLYDNHVICVWADAGARGYNAVHYEKRIPVLAKTADNTTLAFADFDELPVEVDVNEDVRFVVTPDPNEDRPLQRIHFFHGTNFRDHDEEPDRDGGYTTQESWNDPGEYTVYARVTYDEPPENWDWNDGDPRTWVNTNALTVKVRPTQKQIAPFTIEMDKDEASRGETVGVTFIRDAQPPKDVTPEEYGQWEYGLNLWYDSQNPPYYDWHWDWAGDWTTSEDGKTQTRQASFATAGLPEGDYLLSGSARYPGYSAYTTDDDGRQEVRLTVTSAQLPDSNIVFNVDKTEALTEENIGLSIYAPGANGIDLYRDYDNNPGWSEHWDGESVSDSRCWSNAGAYTLVARAWYPCWETDGEGNIIYDDNDNPIPVMDSEGHHEHWYMDSEPVTITIVTDGDKALTFENVSVPDCIYGEVNGNGVMVFDQDTDLTATFPMPENAERMDAGARVQGWDNDLINTDLEAGAGDSIVLSWDAKALNALELREDNVIEVWANAHRTGYEAADYNKRVLVLRRQSDKVKLTVDDPALQDEAGVVNVQVYQNTDLTVSAVDQEDRIEEVQFFGGYDFRNIDRLGEDETEYHAGVCFGDEGEHTVYAKVRLQGSDEWINTNPISIVTAASGTVGEFSQIHVEPGSVPRGELVTVAFDPVENADSYELRHRSVDGVDYDLQWQQADAHTMTFYTDGMPEGVYRLSVWANGKEGYLGRESAKVELRVTEYEGNRIQLTLEKTQLQTNENINASVYAPGAIRVGLEINGQRFDYNEVQEPCWNGDSANCNWPSWNMPGTYTAVPWAEFADESGESSNWEQGTPVSFTVTANNGLMPIDTSKVPASLGAGEEKSFTIARPGYAAYLDYEVFKDGMDEPIARSDGNQQGNLVIDLDGNYVEGDNIRLHVWSGGFGYEHNDINLNIPVLGAADEGVKVLKPEGVEQFLVHTDYTFTVSAPGADKVKFHDGHGLSGECDVDGNGQCQFDVRHWETGRHTFYAMARFGDSWVTSDPLSVDFGISGPTEPTAVNVPEYVWTGSDCVITVDGPGENWYDFQLLPQDRNYDERRLNFMYGDDEKDDILNNIGASILYDGDGNATVTIPGDQLNEGDVYIVSVGFDGPGTGRTTVEKTFRVVSPSVKLSTAKRIYYYGDIVSFSVDAPLAESVGIYRDGDENPLQDNAWQADDCGNITFTAVAAFDGIGDLTDQVTIEVRTLGPAPAPEVSGLPEALHVGKPLSFNVGTVDGWRSVFVDDEETDIGDDGNVTVENLDVGEHNVRIDYGADGYDNGSADYTVRVDGHDYVWFYDGDAEATQFISATLTCACGEAVDLKDDLNAASDFSRDIVTYPTCTENGLARLTASVEYEGETYAAEWEITLMALGHEFGDWTICWDEEPGTAHAERSCKNCDEVETTVVQVEESENTATCTEAGTVTYTAKLKMDDVVVVSDTETVDVEALGHDWDDGEVTTQPGCETKGVRTYTCSRCEQTRTEEIDPLGHKWDDGEVTTQPGCETKGEITYTCPNCQETRTEEIDPLGHNWGDFGYLDESDKPTCEKAGVQTSKCSGCNATRTKSVAKLGHQWRETVNDDDYVWSDDWSTVTATRVCERDASHTETVTVQTTSKVTQEPTCSAVGVLTYTATFKKSPFTTQTKTKDIEIDPNAHTYGEPTYTWADDNSTVTATIACIHNPEHVLKTQTVNTSSIVNSQPTCDDKGEITYSAQFEDADFEDQSKTVETDALGHSYGEPTYIWAENNSTVTATRTCANNAGHVETETVNTAVNVTTPATCETAGVTTYTATFTNTAFATQTKTVENLPAALGHVSGTPVYTWSRDNTSVTATIRCTRNTSHVLKTETVKTTPTRTKEPTYQSTGTMKYTTDKFSDPAFTIQTKTVEIPKLEKDSAVKAVEAKINALSSNAGLNDKDAVTAAQNAYNSLSDVLKQQVDPALVSKLETAQKQVQAAEEAAKAAAEKKAADEKAANAVIDAINALSANAGVNDKAAVAAARAAYDALTNDQKALVSADVLNKLTTAENQVKAAEEKQAAAEEAAKKAAEEAAAKKTADETAAKAAIAKINALSNSAGLNDKAAVAAARAAYDALTSDQKALVSAEVLAKLTTAETQVKAAEEAAAKKAADEAAANDVIAKINALSDSAGLNDKDAVAAARAAYDALTDDQKALVSADVLAKLTTAEAQVKAAEEEAAKIKIGKCKITVKDLTYTGKAVTAKAMKKAVIVQYGDKTLKYDTDYTITYDEKAKDIGAYKLTVTGKGTYTGSKKATFKINPKRTAFTKLTGGKQQITLKWKNPKNVTGYEIEYSLKKDFSGSKTVKIKKAKTLTTTVKKLKAGKMYYVRIRTYTTVKKKTYYSAWSAAKSVKTKAGKAKNEFTVQNAEVTMNVGEALDLKSMLPQEVSDDQQVWETDASATASVTENGIVTALQPGTAVITVTNGDGEQVVFTVRISGEELNMPDLSDIELLPVNDEEFTGEVEIEMSMAG